jgi:hypothetical protein
MRIIFTSITVVSSAACLLNLINDTLPAPSHVSTIVMFSNLNHDSRTGSPDAVRCPSQYSFPGQLLPSLCTQDQQAHHTQCLKLTLRRCGQGGSFQRCVSAYNYPIFMPFCHLSLEIYTQAHINIYSLPVIHKHMHSAHQSRFILTLTMHTWRRAACPHACLRASSSDHPW